MHVLCMCIVNLRADRDVSLVNKPSYRQSLSMVYGKLADFRCFSLDAILSKAPYVPHPF